MIRDTKTTLDGVLQKRIEHRKRRNLWRTQRVVDEDQHVVFCSNDYLGLARELREEGTAADRGGSGASRLVSGTHPEHVAVERDVAQWMKTESARFFATGYQANVGALSSLIERDDAVFSDELNHASIIDGLRLSRGERRVFAHRNLDALRRELDATDVAGARWIVTDAIFSMDGDVADLDALVRVADEYNAFLYVDEAHSLGVRGPEGRGLAASLDLIDEIDVIVGPCGKSLGGSGSFVAGTSVLCDYLYNAARSFVFSTAPPPDVCRRISLAIRELAKGERQQELWRNIHQFAAALTELGWWRGEAQSAVFPVVVGDEEMAVSVSDALFDSGFFVHPIRPPTVPPGTSRLRVTITAAHTRAQVDGLVHALVEACEKAGCTPRCWSHE